MRYRVLPHLRRRRPLAPRPRRRLAPLRSRPKSRRRLPLNAPLRGWRLCVAAGNGSKHGANRESRIWSHSQHTNIR